MGSVSGASGQSDPRKYCPDLANFSVFMLFFYNIFGTNATGSALCMLTVHWHWHVDMRYGNIVDEAAAKT